MKLLVILNSDRDIPGTLEEVGGFLAGIPCLGRSDNTAAKDAGNPSRHPAHKMGDTPSGKYTARLCPASSQVAKFGPYQLLLLDGFEGQALEAKRNGRSGLMMHGGDPSRNGSRGGLRPTNGCIRLKNEHMKLVVQRMAAMKLQEIEVEVREKV